MYTHCLSENYNPCNFVDEFLHTPLCFLVILCHSGNTFLDTSRRSNKRIESKNDNSQQQVILTNEASNRTLLEGNGKEPDSRRSTEAILNGQDIHSRESIEVIQNSSSDSAALEHLETKISNWLTGDSFINHASSKRNSTPRITKLHRTQTEVSFSIFTANAVGLKVQIRQSHLSPNLL